MTTRSRTALAAATAGMVLCAMAVVGAITVSAQDDQSVVALRTSISSAERELRVAQDALYDGVEDLADIAIEYDARTVVLAERPAFLAAVASADAAFATASGKVSVDEQRTSVLAAQSAVLAERTDPTIVQAQTAAVTEIATNVTAEVRAYDERAAAAEAHPSRSAGPTRGAQAAGPSGGGGGWFANFRQYLNDAGGSHITLVEYDGQCGSVFASACSYSGGTIKVHSSIANMSVARQRWAAVHEYAHQFHFNSWSAVNASTGYQQLFGSNPEILANCMSSARGYSNHGHRCTPEMVDWAAAIWNNQIAW